MYHEEIAWLWLRRHDASASHCRTAAQQIHPRALGIQQRGFLEQHDPGIEHNVQFVRFGLRTTVLALGRLNAA